MKLHLARKLQKLLWNILHEYCSILQYFLKSIVKAIMLGSSTACRILNDCHSPSSNFSFMGADGLYWLGEPALHTSLLNQLGIGLFWYVTQQASLLELFLFAPGTAIKRYFLLHLQCRQFVLLPTVVVWETLYSDFVYSLQHCLRAF